MSVPSSRMSGLNRALVALAAPALLLGSVNASAQCTLETGNLTFDDYDVFSAQDTVGTGYIYVTCDLNVQYTIALTTGSSGTFTPRTLVMTGAPALRYNLTSSPSSGVAWDNVTNVYVGKGSGARQAIPVYGRIAAGQTGAMVGPYSDSLTVTLTTQ